MDVVNDQLAQNGHLAQSGQLSEASGVEQVRGSFNGLRGELYGMVEAAGMWPKQEDAWKRIIRNSTYDCQRRLERLVSRKAV